MSQKEILFDIITTIMNRATRLFEGWAYFALGAVLIYFLNYAAQVADGKTPEDGVGIEILTLLVFAGVYYAAFLVVQRVLSRFCKHILEPQYFFPASLASGFIVVFVFVSGLDFLFWLLYQKDMGTIFLSALVAQVLFLLVNSTICFRIAHRDELSLRNVWMVILLLSAGIVLLALGVPLLFA